MHSAYKPLGTDRVRSGSKGLRSAAKAAAMTFCCSLGPAPTAPARLSQATAFWDSIGLGLQPVLRAINGAIPRGLRTRPRPARLPRPPPPQPETPPAELESLLSRVDGAKAEWVKVGAKERRRLLRACMGNFIELCRDIAAASAAAKGAYEGGLGDEM